MTEQARNAINGATKQKQVPSPPSDVGEGRAYDILWRRHQNDDRLMAERISIFLLASSFLFLGFVGLLGVDQSLLLRIAVPIVGLVLCMFAFVAARRTSAGLDFWDKGEKEYELTGTSFQTMREKIVELDGKKYPLVPSSVYEYGKHLNIGGWPRNRHIYTYGMPGLFASLWVVSLLWVLLFDP